MIAPDQNLSDFPRWIWPYINVAKLADLARVRDPGTASLAAVPRAAIDAHVSAIIGALTVRKVAINLGGDLGKQMEAAATRALATAIDDCGSTGKKPWPRPPKHILLQEIAGSLAIAAVELEGDKVLSAGLQEAATSLSKLAEQSIAAAAHA